MGIVRVGGRGTTRRVAKKEEDNWSGDAYKKYQDAKKAASKDKYITVGRGTGKIKFGDITPSTSKNPTGKGMWVRTGRGTGKRKVE